MGPEAHLCSNRNFFCLTGSLHFPFSYKNGSTKSTIQTSFARPASCDLESRSEFVPKMSKADQPVVGVPYFVGMNPYQAGMIPPNAVYSDPKGIPIHQTMFRDTPAPFNCPYCGESGLTDVRSKPSLAAVVGCMMPLGLGICFLCPSMNCLWHKYHYCPSCHQKVADFEKSDPCAVVDVPQWKQDSFAVPA